MKTKTVERGNRLGSAPVSGAVLRALAKNAGAPKPAKRPSPLRAPKAGTLPKSSVPAPVWQLRLYVMDATPKSALAFANLKQFCETYLKGRYRITVIDLLKQPQLAKGDQILAIPTVVRQLPKPVRTIIGNLSNIERVLIGLDLRAAN